MPSRTPRAAVVPSGFDGFVMSTPRTRVPAATASSYAARSAPAVTWNPAALSQLTGTMFTPVLHLKSLSNLHERDMNACQDDDTTRHDTAQSYS
ncbi:Os05g0196633 [Oryza sativa Japonica Group]|uniref:Os05g0196633 protein n=1 Tax=Oryza sativa subsp. japonica TaxID=39947 RepID=A0A0P0WJD2_ORYSJ|nr:Os05g0196633 [Oryza sativa Japonica Group]